MAFPATLQAELFLVLPEIPIVSLQINSCMWYSIVANSNNANQLTRNLLLILLINVGWRSCTYNCPIDFSPALVTNEHFRHNIYLIIVVKLTTTNCYHKQSTNHTDKSLQSELPVCLFMEWFAYWGGGRLHPNTYLSQYSGWFISGFLLANRAGGIDHLQGYRVMDFNMFFTAIFNNYLLEWHE